MTGSTTEKKDETTGLVNSTYNILIALGKEANSCIQLLIPTLMMLRRLTDQTW
jgi:hypothetical protein